MPAIYFSLGLSQPFAPLERQEVEEGVTVVRDDRGVVGLRLEDARMLLRLDEICATLGIDPEKAWDRLRADEDVPTGRRKDIHGGVTGR